MTAIPSIDFRGAMRRLTSTVSVISGAHDGEWFGMTATAVTSVCDDPPALLICVNQSASIHAPLHVSGRFCVNILQVGQEFVSGAFSGRLKGADRFAQGRWAPADDGLPYLQDAQANIFCTVERFVQFGTHGIFIGAVDAVCLADRIAPLLYEDGKYMRSTHLEQIAGG